MKHWPSKPLGELVDFIGGGTPRRDRPDYWGGEIPWASVKDLQSQSLKTTLENITAKGLANSSSNLIPKGTVIIASRVGLGKVAINLKPVAINQDLKALRLRSSDLSPRYLLLFLLSKAEYFERAGVGATVKGLTLADYQKLDIVSPPLAVQGRIVKLLDEADELRKLRTQADQRSAALIPSLFHDMFGDPETNPKGWPSGQLKDFGAEIRYGLGQPPEEDPEGVPLLRATNIKQGCISEIGLIRVRRMAVPASRNAILNADDVLIVRSGAYTGDVARVGEKWAGSVAGYDLVASPMERLTGDFMAWFLLSEFVQDRYFNGLKLRAAQPHLNSAQVSETPLFCPPLPLQKEFAARVSEIRAVQAEQATSRRRLDELFQSLLHRAFKGEL
jgi:type I restriction enzyme S subunit